jgi:hypothetical protein
VLDGDACDAARRFAGTRRGSTALATDMVYQYFSPDGGRLSFPFSGEDGWHDEENARQTIRQAEVRSFALRFHF